MNMKSSNYLSAGRYLRRKIKNERDEVQAFLAKFIGRCKNCGHALKSISTVHRYFENGNGSRTLIYPSGLSLSPTHWDITEVDEGEATGIGCTQCEKGLMHRVRVDHTSPYCEEDPV